MVLILAPPLVEGRVELETVLTRPAEARATDGPGRSHGVYEMDGGGRQVIHGVVVTVTDSIDAKLQP